MKSLKGEITWEILYPDSLIEKTTVTELGYMGGIRIGRERIFLLKHHRVVEQKLRISAPRFMLFDDKADPKKRETGLPMSRDEFERILRFLFAEDELKEVLKQIYDPASQVILQKK